MPYYREHIILATNQLSSLVSATVPQAEYEMTPELKRCLSRLHTHLAGMLCDATCRLSDDMCRVSFGGWICSQASFSFCSALLFFELLYGALNLAPLCKTQVSL